jgi:hypothetical protein
VGGMVGKCIPCGMDLCTSCELRTVFNPIEHS